MASDSGGELLSTEPLVAPGRPLLPPLLPLLLLAPLLVSLNHDLMPRTLGREKRRFGAPVLVPSGASMIASFFAWTPRL
jgi:hypothetical protein